MTTATIDPASRTVPPFGGFNRTVLEIELKRMLRNRRTIFFTLVFPAGLFFAFGGQVHNGTRREAIWAYNASADTWTRAQVLPSAVSDGQAVDTRPDGVDHAGAVLVGHHLVERQAGAGRPAP